MELLEAISIIYPELLNRYKKACRKPDRLRDNVLITYNDVLLFEDFISEYFGKNVKITPTFYCEDIKIKDFQYRKGKKPIDILTTLNKKLEAIRRNFNKKTADKEYVRHEYEAYKYEVDMILGKIVKYSKKSHAYVLR